MRFSLAAPVSACHPFGFTSGSTMQLLTRFCVAALLAAALMPSGEAAADAAHPLDPTASAGAVVTKNSFEGFVPLLSRENPAPSFIKSEPPAPNEERPASVQTIPMDHSGMAHGAPQGATAP